MKADKDLIKQWKKEERMPFKGWDFSYIKNRIIEEKPPWNYAKIARQLIRKSKSVLDMETGGGEIFSSLGPFPKHAIAYEGYKPNVKVARKRLKPLGIKVIESRNPKHLPFKDKEFDLILNRHGALDAPEIYRILKEEGIFFTQQVTGSSDLQDLVKEFKANRRFSNITLERYEKEIRRAGLHIIKKRKWKGKMIFKDVGAIIYYLKAIPWIVPGFSVNKHLKHLIKLHNKIDYGKGLEFEMSRFMILAQKK